MVFDYSVYGFMVASPEWFFVFVILYEVNIVSWQVKKKNSLLSCDYNWQHFDTILENFQARLLLYESPHRLLKYAYQAILCK